MKRIAVAATIVFCASPALADPDEGRACDTSAECAGGLHCIDGVCAAIDVNGRLRERARVSGGTTAMLGDGHGYVVPVVVGDVIATAVTGLFVGLSFSASGYFAIAALFPTTLTGPIIHAANGRPAPAVISFFAWASAPPTSVTLGVFLGFGTQANIIVAGTVTGLVCAAGLTALDAYFAREVKLKSRPSDFSVRPTIFPTRDGLSASLVGTF